MRERGLDSFALIKGRQCSRKHISGISKRPRERGSSLGKRSVQSNPTRVSRVKGPPFL